MTYTQYKPKEHLKPQGLTNISDAQINDHWNLYVGYVNNTNQLNADLQTLIAQKASPLLIADRRRRYGFEYNGMILHEYYFENLTSTTPQNPTNNLAQALQATWGSIDAWKEDFCNTGKSRGIGWAILYGDPLSKNLTNHFIMDHENGPITHFKPLLVMDVWEHAYMVDHNAGGRANYIQAFLENISWQTVEQRFANL